MKKWIQGVLVAVRGGRKSGRVRGVARNLDYKEPWPVVSTATGESKQ